MNILSEEILIIEPVRGGVRAKSAVYPNSPWLLCASAEVLETNMFLVGLQANKWLDKIVTSHRP